ncbi:unnamed protein product [Gongylonema pulchrum]|uniref:Uncharacterized protein n=1 Tax=Gongylonema pulchrum TaxID=637853 RepID=A0A183EP80_9BILA|nr:unnamed protein product [Gongylonema pulchrum]
MSSNAIIRLPVKPCNLLVEMLCCVKHQKMQKRRAALQEEQQQLHRTRPKELDVEIKRNQLSELENRLKSTRSEQNKILNQTIKKLEEDIDNIVTDARYTQNRINDVRVRMDERNEHIEQLQNQRNVVTDEVFRKFCERINIRDIRQYEQREMRFHEEMQEQLKKFDNELDRIRNELDYLKSEDKRGISYYLFFTDFHFIFFFFTNFAFLGWKFLQIFTLISTDLS